MVTNITMQENVMHQPERSAHTFSRLSVPVDCTRMRHDVNLKPLKGQTLVTCFCLSSPGICQSCRLRTAEGARWETLLPVWYGEKAREAGRRNGRKKGKEVRGGMSVSVHVRLRNSWAMLDGYLRRPAELILLHRSAAAQKRSTKCRSLHAYEAWKRQHTHTHMIR